MLTTAGRGLLSAVRVEDGVLAGWSFALPSVAAWLGLGPASMDTGRPMPLVGLVQLLAVLGAFAALLTRPSDQPPIRVANADAPRWIICGPLIGGLAFASSGAATNLGLESGDWVIGLALIAILVGTLAADHLPVVSAPLRRAFVMPFVLVAAAYFNGFAALFLQGLDIRSAVASSPGGDIGFAVFILFLVLAGMAAFYAMFVVAPRELAEPNESGPRWVVRFALYLAASLLGVGWLAVIGG